MIIKNHLDESEVEMTLENVKELCFIYIKTLNKLIAQNRISSESFQTIDSVRDELKYFSSHLIPILENDKNRYSNESQNLRGLYPNNEKTNHILSEIWDDKSAISLTFRRFIELNEILEKLNIFK